MLFIDNDVIYVTKGDDAIIDVGMNDAQGVPYVCEPGDTLLFMVKREPKADAPALLSVRAVGNTVTLRHEDTAAMAVGEYSADVQLITSGGLRHTVWPSLPDRLRTRETNFKNFVVMPEVVTA